MKLLAYVANVAFLIFSFAIFFMSEHLEGMMIMMLMLFFALPVVNLIALAASGNGSDFFSLYFERKRLEQEQKIISLKKSMGREI